MYLTSFRRSRIAVGNCSDNNDNRRMLSGIIAGVSSAIEGYLNREIELKSRTEDFDLWEGQRTIFTESFPITSITSLKLSPTGLFTGEEETLTLGTDYVIGKQGRSIELLWGARGQRMSCRTVTVAGLALDPVQSTFTLITLGVTALIAGNYVLGSLSGAQGIIISHSTITGVTVIENMQGVFRVGDILSAFTAEDLTGTAIVNANGTINVITAQSLAEAYPAITMVAEIEVNYFYTNNKNGAMWLDSTSADGTSKRGNVLINSPVAHLQEESRMILTKYRRVFL